MPFISALPMTVLNLSLQNLGIGFCEITDMSEPTNVLKSWHPYCKWLWHHDNWKI